MTTLKDGSVYRLKLTRDGNRIQPVTRMFTDQNRYRDITSGPPPSAHLRGTPRRKSTLKKRRRLGETAAWHARVRCAVCPFGLWRPPPATGRSNFNDDRPGLAR
jgi:hypothetical protein